MFLTVRKFPGIVSIICVVLGSLLCCIPIIPKHIGALIAGVIGYLLPVLFACWAISGIQNTAEDENPAMSADSAPGTSGLPAGNVYARCTHCNTLFTVEAEWQGQQTTCSNCQQLFTINIEK